MSAPLLRVEDLTIAFGPRPVVRNLSFSLHRGETLALVGESGSGKSLSALSTLRLLPPAARILSGRIALDGTDVLAADDRALQRLRGGVAGMIFQEPMTSLNPLHGIGRQVGEAVTLHRPLAGAALRARVLELLRLAGLPRAEERIAAYPHQLSGGQRQRVMIAAALANDPKLLIADEPTTALDVTIQAQILELMRDLKHRVGAAIVLITHDLGVVAEVAERVVVMYAGRKVEEAPVGQLFRTPRHPYTQGLLGSMPRLGSSLTGTETRLAEIPGLVPSLKQKIPGCVFASRCPHATDLCRQVAPALELKAPGHIAACHYATKEGAIAA